MLTTSSPVSAFDARIFGINPPTQISLQEWLPKEIELSPQQVSDLLKCPPNVLQMQTLPGGIYRLQSRATIGHLKLGNIELRILPKYPMPSLLTMLAEVYELARLTPQLVGYETSPEVVDLLVQIFLNHTDRTIRQGLKRTYVQEEDELVAIRGRIDIRQTANLHLRGKAKAHCRYEEFTLDGPENRTLLGALTAIAQSKLFPVTRRDLAHRMASEFVGVEAGASALNGDTRITYDRVTVHYHPALELANLILRSMGVAQEFGVVEGDGFLLNMNQLFERFVCRKLTRTLNAHRVEVGEQTSHAFDADEQCDIRPDMIIRSYRGRRLVADTKYKVGTVADPADLYQILTYCHVLKVSHGILITVGDERPKRYDVLDGTTTIEVIPINLDGSIDEIQASLSELADRMLQILMGNE